MKKKQKQKTNYIIKFFNNSIILICWEQLQEDIHINSINRFVGVNVGVKEARNSQTDKEARNSQTDKAKKQRTSNEFTRMCHLLTRIN